MKKQIAVLVLVAALIPMPASAFFPYALESTQWMKWGKQLKKMKKQIELLEKKWGVTAPSEVHGVPTTWQDVVAMQTANGTADPSTYAGLMKQYEQAVQTIEDALLPSYDGGRTSRAYKQNQAEVKAAFAMAENMFNSLEKRIGKLHELAGQINAKKGVRAAVDLNSRIQLENATIQVEMMRMMAMTQRLTANALNNETQATAGVAEFFMDEESYMQKTNNTHTDAAGSAASNPQDQGL